MIAHNPHTKRLLDRAVHRAWMAEQRGSLALAASLAKRILSEYPGNPEARFILARILARTGKLEEAIVEFKLLLQDDSSFDAARLALVGALFLVNSYKEGIDHVRFLIGECVDAKEAPPEAEPVLASLWQSYQNRGTSDDDHTARKDNN